MTRDEALAELERVIWDPNHEDRVARYEKLKSALRDGAWPPGTKAITIHGEITAMEMMRKHGAKYAIEHLKDDLVKKLAQELVDSRALQVHEQRSFNRDVYEIDMQVRVVLP